MVVFADLKRGHLVDAQPATARRTLGSSRNLAPELGRVRLQLEHPEQMTEDVLDSPPDAVGVARPVLLGQCVDEGEQSVVFGPGERDRLVVIKWINGIDRNRIAHLVPLDFPR
jgi:hypothetical protein